MAKQTVVSGVEVNGVANVGNPTAIRRLQCMVPCVAGQCQTTADAKRVAWNGTRVQKLGTGPTSAIVKLADGRDQIVGSENRMFLVVVTDPNFVAVYTPEFLATSVGQLFAKLSASRTVDEFTKIMRAFANDDTAFDPNKMFSSSKNRNWQAARSSGTKSAWRIGTTGGVILLPLTPLCATCFGSESTTTGGKQVAAPTSQAVMDATFADCV